MSEKFTQGEWRAEDFNEWDIAGVFIVDKEDNPIAKMCERFVKIPMTGSNFSQLVESKEEQEANAHLIAAAPELYKELSRECVICKLKDHNVVCDFCRIGEVLKKARGAE